MSLVALIDYGSGNLRSVEKALERAARERASGHTVAVTADPAVAAKAERIVLPGVGAFADCMRGLLALPGMVEALSDAVLKRGVPFLGICVGMQLLASVGREFGDHKGLGWIPGEVVRIAPSDTALKIPHMGWNELNFTRPHPLFAGLEPGVHAYFVHSYVIRPADAAHVLATCDYGGPFAAAVGRDNIAGTQFHPEKSQAAGLTILGNFLEWTP
jgi:imidazole glycerol-phosphate synthase subunit HisH